MRALGLVGIALSALACTPAFESEPWRVEETRVLSIVSEPAEARPGEVVQLSALVASGEGALAAAPTWSVCTRPRASDERTGVTQRCLRGDALDPTLAAMTVLPDACARFGPNVPPAEGDAPRQRPSDPDPSGGYFLPIRADIEDAAAFGAVRIRCDLPGVTRAIFDAFEDRYETNENPTLEVTVPAVVEAGDRVELGVTLPEGASEPYVRYDVERGVLVDTREWLRVQWFVTEGILDRGQDTLTPAPGGPARTSAAWEAPAFSTTVQGWVVVTDARGGAAWQGFTAQVRE